ncbi:MAG: FHA domain-containing protein [Nitrospinota bacterium]
MAKLIISTKDKVLQSVELRKTITLGREVGDIVIKNPAISARHLRIKKDNDTYSVDDLNSTNGTYVNDSKITTHKLKSGDVITVGKFNLKFFDPKEEEQAAKSSSFSQVDDLGGKTMVINSADVKAMLEAKHPPTGLDSKWESPESPAAGPLPKKPQAPQAPKQATDPLLIFLSPTGTPKIIKLTKDTTLIGSAPNADIKVRGGSIGSIAVIIQKSSMMITFQGGEAKLKVNDKEVTSHKLEDKDKFSIGPYMFEFRN